MSDELVTDPDSLFAVTFFTNYAATHKSEAEWSLEGLALHIGGETASKKDKLP